MNLAQLIHTVSQAAIIWGTASAMLVTLGTMALFAILAQRASISRSEDLIRLNAPAAKKASTWPWRPRFLASHALHGRLRPSAVMMLAIVFVNLDISSPALFAKRAPPENINMSPVMISNVIYAGKEVTVPAGRWTALCVPTERPRFREALRVRIVCAGRDRNYMGLLVSIAMWGSTKALLDHLIVQVALGANTSFSLQPRHVGLAHRIQMRLRTVF